MNIKKLKLFESIIYLHDWRTEYNGEKIGFGYDQYAPNEKFHSSEAYALWGSGYLKLFKLTKENFDLLLFKESPKNYYPYLRF